MAGTDSQVICVKHLLKRGRFLFAGIGLSLCKKIMTLLGGEIWLDDKYDSGVEGCPGARFVISLEKQPLSEDIVAEHTKTHLIQEGKIRASIRRGGSDATLGNSIASLLSTGSVSSDEVDNLPGSLSVLFVDDDVSQIHGIGLTICALSYPVHIPLSSPFKIVPPAPLQAMLRKVSNNIAAARLGEASAVPNTVFLSLPSLSYFQGP